MYHKMMACCIFKDEARDMPAWIEYHKLVGFDHFMLYNNRSSDNYKERLTSYVDDGTITLFEWPIPQSQARAYTHCIQRFRELAEWIAFLDSDEYLLPTGDVALYDYVTALKPKIAGVSFNWAVFGNNGHRTRPPGLTIEEFTMRAERPFCRNRHTKSIINPRKIHHCADPHTFQVIRESIRNVSMQPMWNPKDKVLNWPNVHPVIWEPFRVNHYLVRSRDQCKWKCRERGRATKSKKREFKPYWDTFNRNDVRDEEILRYVPQVKEALRARNLL